jgi:DHA3 family macrolide efflux protein-like MFS transporter
MKRPEGFKAFLLVWCGQLISVLGSGLSGFALSLWVYRETNSAMAMASVQVAYTLPFLLVSPLAGALVDRYNRKLMMAVSDAIAAIGTIGLLAASATCGLQLWMYLTAAALAGLGNSFQWPAYSAAISVMVPKEQYGRANGLMSLVETGPGVIAPILAGALLPFLGLTGILALDLATFIFALIALFAVEIPSPPRSSIGEAVAGQSLFRDSLFGFRYIFAQPGLLGLQLCFLVVNLFSGVSFTLIAPGILAYTGQNAIVLGSVNSALALGGLAGALLMSAWGGFKRRVVGVAVGCASIGIGLVAFGFGRGLVFWSVAGIAACLTGPLANASSQAIWQAKVPADIQGRVFSARRLISWFTTPLSPFLAGFLADRVFEPFMGGVGAPTGSKAPALLATLFGSGPGAGMSLIISIGGLLCVAASCAIAVLPRVRNVEDEEPRALPARSAT